MNTYRREDNVESVHRPHTTDRDILYSRTIRAGRRIYYMDVKSNLRDELFIAITESKKTRETEGGEQVYERHKVFLYPEDFERFMESLEDVLSYARRRNKETGRRVEGGEYGY